MRGLLHALKGVADVAETRDKRMICWKCHESVGGPVCVGCGAIQPPRPGSDPFTLLGIERRFSIETTEVDSAWRELSRRVHPDRFAGRSAVERRMSLQWTANINEARRILREPRTRAHFLATGLATPAEDRKLQLSPEFLEEMFELQMEVKMDPSGTRPEVEARSEKLWMEIRSLFAQWESEGGALDGVEQLLAQLRYVDNALAMTESSEPG